MAESEGSVGALEAVLRWERSGGAWRVLLRTEALVTVALLTCDAATQMGEVSAAPGELDGFLAGRTSSED